MSTTLNIPEWMTVKRIDGENCRIDVSLPSGETGSLFTSLSAVAEDTNGVVETGALKLLRLKFPQKTVQRVPGQPAPPPVAPPLKEMDSLRRQLMSAAREPVVIDDVE